MSFLDVAGQALHRNGGISGGSWHASKNRYNIVKFITFSNPIR
jgi:hypothetical protein